MTAATAEMTVTFRCPGCGLSWDVARRPGAALPKTARCALRRGGCGKVFKVPRHAATTGGRTSAATVTIWDPPSEARHPRPVDEPCPDCDAVQVHASARGTIRACLGCRQRVMPPGVSAPYERGAGVTRVAKSQRERDLEALDLAGRKGVMLDQLHALACDDRLDRASVLKVEWFAEQVKTAAGGARLDELSALSAAAGIRPRRWWQRQPAPLTAGYDDENDTEDGYAVYADDDGGDQADEPASALAVPARQHRAEPRRMTWAEASAACGWRLSPTAGGCQIIDERSQLCGADTTVMHDIGGGWICATHYGMLASVITRDYRRQQRRTA